MAHQQQFDFFQSLSNQYPEFFKDTKVAEIGSLDINGSIRGYFSTENYTGYDIAPGQGVDIVEQGQLIGAPTASYDVIASTECFEHNPYWVETFANMLRMVKPSGMIMLTCATTGRQEHGTTKTNPHDSPLTTRAGWDYYQNLDANDFLNTFNLTQWFDGFHFLMCPQTFDLYFYGIRSNPSAPFQSATFVQKLHDIETQLHQLNQSIRIGFWTNDHAWCPR